MTTTSPSIRKHINIGIRDIIFQVSKNFAKMIKLMVHKELYFVKEELREVKICFIISCFAEHTPGGKLMKEGLTPTLLQYGQVHFTRRIETSRNIDFLQPS